MTKQEELDLFLVRCDELINGKYILADVKIVNLLKAVANSETIVAIFKNCLKGFDYEKETMKCFIKSEYLGGDKGEFKQPESSKTLLALVFSVLMDIDAKNIDFGDFLSKYFYENGSYYESYNSFAKSMIVPFKFTVKKLMTGIIDGSVGDPINDAKAVDTVDNQEEENKEDVKVDADATTITIERIISLVTADGNRVSEKSNEDSRNEGIIIIDEFIKALRFGNKDDIAFKYLAYKYYVKSALKFFNNSKSVKELINNLFE